MQDAGNLLVKAGQVQFRRLWAGERITGVLWCNHDGGATPMVTIVLHGLPIGVDGHDGRPCSTNFTGRAPKTTAVNAKRDRQQGVMSSEEEIPAAGIIAGSATYQLPTSSCTLVHHERVPTAHIAIAEEQEEAGERETNLRKRRRSIPERERTPIPHTERRFPYRRNPLLFSKLRERFH